MSGAGVAARRVLPFVVTVAILGTLLGRIDLAAALDTLTLGSAGILVPSILLYGLASLAIEGISLSRLSRVTGRPADAITCTRIKAASYTLGMLNYALGFAALSVLFQRRVGLGLAASAGLVATVSFADLAMLLSVAVVALAFAAGEGPTLQLGTVGLVGGGIGIGLAVLRTPRSLGALDWIRDLELFRTVRSAPLATLCELAVLRVAFVFTFIGAGFGSMVAFGVEVPAGEFVVGMAVVALVGALPIAVAGLGTVQLATVEMFQAHADEATLVACSLSMQAAMLVVRMSMGLLFAREFTREAAEATRGVET